MVAAVTGVQRPGEWSVPVAERPAEERWRQPAEMLRKTVNTLLPPQLRGGRTSARDLEALGLASQATVV